MLRKLFLGGMAVAITAACWNEYRVWNKHATPGPMQIVAPCDAGDPALQATTAAPVETEPCDSATIIDLTNLLHQTTEPLPAQSEEPCLLPVAPCKPAVAPSHGVEVAEFLPHAAEREPIRPISTLWKVLVEHLRGSTDGEPELLPVMPRPYSEPYRCPQGPGCPYPLRKN